MKTFDFDSVNHLFYCQSSHDLKSVIGDLVVFGKITRDCISKVNQWLKSHSCKYKADTVILYHGTSAKHDIKNEGIKRTTAKTKRSMQSQTGYSYLSIYPQSAMTFANLSYPTEEIALYAVKVRISDLKADLDQLKNKRLWSEGHLGEIKNTVGDSLVFGSGVRLKRDIQPFDIRKVEKLS